MSFTAAVLVDKHTLARAAAERLDAELARAGEEVQHASALDIELIVLKTASLDAVRRGADGHASACEAYARGQFR